jgi:hypothetical protein
MNTPEFNIRILKKIEFFSMGGRWRGDAPVRVYNVGDVIKATAETSTYFIHFFGGIFKDEAERVALT